MPVPASVQFSTGGLPLSGGISIIWDTKPSSMLKRAAARFTTRAEAISSRLGPVTGNAGSAIPVHIHASKDSGALTVDAKEGYSLAVSPTGVVLTADGPDGVVHGFATLLQLIGPGASGPQFALADITDSPRFPWRGLMIDVSRHFMSVETIKRQLDAMELTKLNVMHWHLSDGTGFRVESKRFPKLQTTGGHHQFYTQAQIRDVIAYAGDRGIRIVPEFDIPGHTLSILEAYPELAAQQPVPFSKNWKQTCDVTTGGDTTTASCKKVFNYNNAAIDPSNPEVLNFARELYAEMGRLFPDRYFHSGGDEVVPSQWTGNPKIAAYMKSHGYADAPAMQAAFTAQVQKVLAQQGKIMMGWDEVSEAPIPKEVVVETWRGSKWIGSATRAGHPVVVSAGYYLDLLTPSSTHYKIDPLDVKAVGLSAADTARARKHSAALADAFSLDPDAPPLDDAQKHLVLGGEAPLWSELVSDQMADARLWPRSAAIAERYWSPETVRDVADMESRLPAIQQELETTGLQATENTQRMIDQMSPANTSPLAILTSVTSPVRNYALNRLASRTGDEMLKAPVAVAAPDSFEAMTFNHLAERYAAGDLSVAADLQMLLGRYAGNDSAYEQIATTPALQAARPVSQQLSALAVLGQEAMQPRHHGRAWRKKAREQLALQDQTFAACATAVASYANPQPPSGLLIAILPGIHALVSTAR
ncbi:family 20 glycosylhydrolase [Acetobacter sp. LMG 1636]|uniref:beta-N-acetylhexosaminidase n=2 Tax=Acetobacter fallax TaxID=1737473 RepID=A0ABX0KDF2_9PROT|nr:family 20 glycosylhydrolase [Acetobacter fallax]NHO36808.1 family 20 glycosylhydrolase [Acetobacter fallax]